MQFNSDYITGNYILEHGDEYMDRDYENMNFKDCTILGGDFASSNFKKCRFINVTFTNSALVGVGFIDCVFDNLRFVNCQEGFYFTHCNVVNFSATKWREEDEDVRVATERKENQNR